jgi:hypothetical protein
VETAENWVKLIMNKKQEIDNGMFVYIIIYLAELFRTVA